MIASRISRGRMSRAAMVLLLGAAALVHGCDDDNVAIDDQESICGPCGTIANGDSTISGNASLDGIFKAVGTLDMSTGSIKANFDGRVKNIAGIFGIEAEGMATADLIEEIKAEFSAQISANIQGGLKVDYVPPSCSADISVSASASAQCEAKAGCDVDVSAECDPGELSFACEGKCTGGCTGTCSGSCTVEAELAASCEGTCKGACDLSVEPGVCEGTCKGECSGTCTLENTDGECEGECDGDCTGSCELPSAGGSCSGECKGECVIDASAGVECEGKCEGSCDAECSGGCEGNFEPPSCNAEASANCEASADCQAQAEAQASASLECTPPSLDISVEFSGGVDASAQAEILAKLEAFRVEMVGVVKGMFELKGLIEGNAELDIEPPVVTIGVAIEGFIDEVESGDFKIAAGLLPCVVPAFQEAGDVLVNLAGDMEGTISGQLELSALLGLGA